MLVGERSAILRVATQTELIHVCGLEISSRRAAMGIVAVRAFHLSFAQRMVVGHAHLSALGLVAPEAGIIRLPERLHDGLCFWDHIFHVGELRLGHDIQTGARIRIAFGAVSVGLMAVGTTQLIGGVRPHRPVADLCIMGVATQTHAVGVMRRALLERDDLRNISAALDVQAARTVTLLALDTLLGMKGMPEIFGDVGMACGARIVTHRSSAGNLCIFGE